MKQRTWAFRHPLLIAGALCALAGGPCLSALAQDASSPTLAELARQEQQRKKGIKSTGKVFTDNGSKAADAHAPDGSRPAPADASRPQGPTPPAVSAADADAQASEARDRSEATWRERMKQVREELRRNEMFAEALQTRVNSLSGDFVSRDDPYQRAKIGGDRQKALEELARVKADVERNKKEIAQTEEDARIAGVPPGWLR